MQPIHERMPVIIPPDQYGLWLDPRCQDTGKLAKLLRPFPSEGMLAYRVSTLVNNPKNDVVECVAAAALTTGGLPTAFRRAATHSDRPPSASAGPRRSPAQVRTCRGREKARTSYRKPPSAKNPPGWVNFLPGACVYKMSATETPASGSKIAALADEVEGMMARSQTNFCGNQTPATAQADCLASALATYPLRQ